MADIQEQKNIRNFSIIAHIDAGKSTLADRFLELTGTFRKEDIKEQFLDQMDLERERGITIKMQPCVMEYELSGKKYQLNLIDTPGHMDFAYEVERSLAAVEGAVLLIDVVAGIQAQTLANLRMAQNQGLAIIAAINKIDICPSSEQLQKVKQDIANLLKIELAEILEVSAKTGEGAEKVLKAIVEKIPYPKNTEDGPLQALVFDSFYDNYQGVVAAIRVFSGRINAEDDLFLLQQKKQIKPREVGIFKPQRVKTVFLETGQIGYLATGLKDTGLVKIGETITSFKAANQAEALPGYREPKPMVFANLFPNVSQNFNILKTNLDKLRLNDNALNLTAINNPFLGRGVRAGFLGMLHLEITLERLKREYQTEAVVASPSVIFQAKLKNKKEPMLIHCAVEFPDPSLIEEIREPWVLMTVLCSVKDQNKAHQLIEEKRGFFKQSRNLDAHSLLLQFEAPLSEIIEDFLDKLKSLSQGFASFSYKLLEQRKSDLVRLDFLISRELKPSLSKIVHRSKAEREARDFLKKLKENLPAKNFMQALQAVIGGKVIARENIKALRKDVTAPLYGGDITRKRKLLEKQKKGKKDLVLKGSTAIPQEVYIKLLRK